MKKIANIPKNIIIGSIQVYQLLLSPDHSPIFKGKYPYGYCKFYPSCSEYAKLAVLKHGVFKGTYLSVLRLIKCNPFSHGGLDLVK